VADEVARVAHPCDLPARLGGDEFALLAQLAHPGDVAALAARIVETIGELRFSAPLDMLNVSVSVGVSHCPDESDWSSWYSQADAALYRAKGEGGSTWSLHA
jgi:diguanylate cyclase (GGDEF)-like protein